MASARVLAKPLPNGPRIQHPTHWRTCRYRARTLVSAAECSLKHIGSCLGPIDIAHIDGDFTNNALENLRALCHSHHLLVDRGRIDINNPVMPEFYLDSTGKRRYKKKQKALGTKMQ